MSHLLVVYNIVCKFDKCQEGAYTPFLSFCQEQQKGGYAPMKNIVSLPDAKLIFKELMEFEYGNPKTISVFDLLLVPFRFVVFIVAVRRLKAAFSLP